MKEFPYNSIKAMSKNILLKKSFEFAIEIYKVYTHLLKHNEYTISKQLLRSGTSIGANIREAQEAYSKKDFLHKLNISLKEARETLYWLELLIKIFPSSEQILLLAKQSCSELIAILVSISKTTKQRYNL